MRSTASINKCAGVVKWSTPLGPFVNGCIISNAGIAVSISGDSIVSTTGTEYHYAELVLLDSGSGAVKARVSFKNCLKISAPTCDRQRIVIVTGTESSGDVIALNSATLQVIWRRHISGAIYDLPPNLIGGNVLASCHANQVYSYPVINLSDGTIRGTIKHGGFPLTPSGSEDGKMAFYTDPHKDLVGCDLNSMSEKWRVKGAGTGSAPSDGETVYSGRRTPGSIFSYATKTGRQISKIHVPDLTGLALAPKHRIYAFNDKIFKCINTDTNKPLWSAAVERVCGVAIDCDGYVAISSPTSVALYEPQKGYVLWNTHIKEEPLQPMIGADQRLFLVTSEGAVVALK